MSEPDSGDAESPAPDRDVVAEETRAAGRGFLIITAAKAWFMVTATVLNIGLPRLLADPARFGDFGVVNTFISILNMVIITAALQTVSKRVSERPERAWAVRRAALRWVGGVGLLAFVAVFAGADLLATHVFQDPRLGVLLRIAAFITVAYGVYAVFIGVLNGLKQFRRQAMFDMGFATLKVTLMIGLVLAGFSVAGAITGFAVAALCIAVVAWAVTRRLAPRPASATDQPVLFGAFLVQVMVYTLLVNVLLGADVLILKAGTFEAVIGELTRHTERLDLIGSATEWSPDGLGPVLASESTAALTGLYRATKNISIIPYQAVIAITFVIFPLVSRATFEVDAGATRAYVRQTFRVALILVALLCTALAAGGQPLLILLFGQAYGLAAGALLPLLAAMACFALLFVLATVLIASGRPGDALWVAGLAVALQVGGLTVALGSAVPGPEVLVAFAAVICGAVATGLALMAWLVRRRLGVSVPWLSTLRVVGSAALGIAAAWPLDLPGIGGIFVRSAVACVVLAVALWLSRELTRQDLRLVGRILRRRQA